MGTHDMRREYRRGRLEEESVLPDPIEQFRHWFAQAAETVTGHWYEANAMALATVDADGQPDVRVVLLKEIDDDALVFYTFRSSAKGRQIAGCPHVAVALHWPWLERQVRVRGRVEPLDDARADRYFHRRPRGSQLGAQASRQSQVIESREVLDRRLAEAEEAYAEGSVPRPADWGGYRLLPETVEFWQGRENRLHDRLRYRRDGGAWTIERLSP